MHKIIVSFILVLFSTHAQAGQTPWVEVAPGAQLRMIFSDVLGQDNKTMAAMELQMPRGTKTYWRVPGETGLPLQLNIADSTNVAVTKIIWPYPAREISYGYVDYVYHDQLVLPIELQIGGENPHFSGSIILGVCSDICVPVSVDIDYSLSFDKRDSRSALSITQTMSNTPIAWDQPQNPFGALVYEENNQRLTVEINDTDLDVASLIATIGQSYIVFSPPQISAGGSHVIFDKLGGGNMRDMLDQQITLTYLSPDGPYEISQGFSISE